MAVKRETKPKQIVRPSRAEMADLFDGIVEPPKGDVLKALKADVESALMLMVKIGEMEEMLQAHNSALNQKLSKFIPDSMRACAMKEYTHESGMKVTLKEFLSGSLPKDPAKRSIALRWIHDNGGKDLIRNKFDIELERGDEKTRKGMIAQLRKLHVDFEEKVDVNHMSMQAFVRERMENGLPVPLDTLGLYAGVAAKITAPKVKKAPAPLVVEIAKPVRPSKAPAAPSRAAAKPLVKRAPLAQPKSKGSAPRAPVKAPSRRREHAVNAGI